MPDGFGPRVGVVSLEQNRAAGVPVVSPATWMQGSELECCWIDTKSQSSAFSFSPSIRRMSENPTTTTSQKSMGHTRPICIAVRLQFVSQCFWCPYALRKGKYCQYSSHLHRSTPPICIAIRLHVYRSAFGKIFVVEVTGMCPNRA